jgi:phospholipase C
VNSQIFDHTSTLMFLENFVQKKYGKTVREENISAWRRAISGDLTSCLRPHDANEPKLDYLDRDKFVVSIQQARYKEVPANYKALIPAEIEAINHNLSHAEAMPHQEPGIRPACALPYELYAEGGLSADRSTFQLRMKAGNEIHDRRSAGAPFNVYVRNMKAVPTMMSASYAVKAGDTLYEEFPLSLFADGHYSIDVHGPNGFYRSFSGGADAFGLQVETSYERRGAQATGNMQVALRNTSAGALTVTVKDNSYKTDSMRKTIAATHATVLTLPLDKSYGWYDFTVMADGLDAEAHFAGRVETGRGSFSDPLMGGLV